MMIRMVGGWVFVLVPAHPGSPGQRAVRCSCVVLWVVKAVQVKATVYVESVRVVSRSVCQVHGLRQRGRSARSAWSDVRRPWCSLLQRVRRLGNWGILSAEGQVCHPVCMITTTTTLQPFYGPFTGPPRWAGGRRELLDFMVQGKINRGRHTDHPAGRHSIRTNQCAPPPSSHFLQVKFPSCHPTNSVKALKVYGPTSVIHFASSAAQYCGMQCHRTAEQKAVKNLNINKFEN